MLTIQELRSSTVKELLQELDAARKNMLKVRINVKTKQEKNTAKAKQAKHYVAQILTVLKEIEEEEKIKSQVSSPKSQEEKK
jgi:ribosomal protein L29